ncbi:MAG: hypothetical protein R3F29_03510 [Planctomycetota bacterium]
MRRSTTITVAVALTIGAGTVAWLGRSRFEDHPAAAQDTAPPTLSAASGIDGYDFAHPTASFTLPLELTEVSALTDIDDHTVACVQDELGAVFFLDLDKGAVSSIQPFGAAGDYEGLTRVGQNLWVLRSDGLMIELTMSGDALTLGRQVELGVEQDDIEGLGFDPTDHVVLVAPKSTLKGDKAARAQRQVFRFDPATGERLDGLALDSTIDRIIGDATRRGIALPTTTAKPGRERVDLKVRFASIAVHPVTGLLFALSAVDRALLVFARDSTLVATQFLDEQQLPKPEGITFLSNGDMVIASEGVASPPRISVFRYHETTREGR